MEEIHKVVFLDIDGVVNTHMVYKEEPDHLKGKRYIDRDGYIFDICSPNDERVSNLQAVTWLDKICHDFNLNIVISSTWRLGHYNETVKALYNSGLSEDVVIEGATPVLSTHERGEEITAYLNKHPDIVDYIVLDDDVFDIAPHLKHLIKIDTSSGINVGTYSQVKAYFDNE